MRPVIRVRASLAVLLKTGSATLKLTWKLRRKEVLEPACKVKEDKTKLSRVLFNEDQSIVLAATCTAVLIWSIVYFLFCQALVHTDINPVFATQIT